MSGWDSNSSEDEELELIRARYQRRRPQWVPRALQAIAAVGFAGASLAVVIGAGSLWWHILGFFACLVTVTTVSLAVRSRQQVVAPRMWGIITVNALTLVIAITHATFITRRLW